MRPHTPHSPLAPAREWGHPWHLCNRLTDLKLNERPPVGTPLRVDYWVLFLSAESTAVRDESELRDESGLRDESQGQSAGYYMAHTYSIESPDPREARPGPRGSIRVGGHGSYRGARPASGGSARIGRHGPHRGARGARIRLTTAPPRRLENCTSAGAPVVLHIPAMRSYLRSNASMAYS